MENNAFDSVESKQDDARESKTISLAPEIENFNWTAYACLFIIGVGSLLPWNFFITPELYWQGFNSSMAIFMTKELFSRKNFKIQTHPMI